MIFKGTESMKRYPHIEGSELKGLPSYGSVTNRFADGIKTYKADPNNMHRLKEAGWKTVGSGSSYIYVRYQEGESND